MTHPAYIREKAVQLRTKNKLTIDEIAERLAISRTTAFYWVGHIEIPKTAKQLENTTAGRLLGNKVMQERYAAKRRAAYEKGVTDYPELVVDPGFRDFLTLFIAEGYKRSRNTVSVANSDPAVLRAVKPWFERFAVNPIRYSIQYHADQDLESLRQGWEVELGIDGRQIAFQRKSNSKQLSGRQWRSRLGVLTISAHDTLFRAQLQAWMDLIRTEWDEAFNLKTFGA